MNCFECAVGGEIAAAVATCRHCGVGLCLEHLGQAQQYTVGGTFFGCPHDVRAGAAATTVTPPEHQTSHRRPTPVGLAP
jgi:hypothetical protein